MKRLILGSDLDLKEICAKPQVVSSVSGDYTNLNLTNLTDIFPPMPGQAFNQAYNLNLERNYFKVKVTVLGVIPQNIRELTQLYCPKCSQTFSFKDIESDCSLPQTSQQFDCPKCGGVEQSSDPTTLVPKERGPYPIFQMCLIAKDDSTAMQDRAFKLYYYSNIDAQQID